MIVWVASYPRSGNTFFRMLLRYLGGVPTYSIYKEKIFAEGKLQHLVDQKPIPKLQALRDSEAVSFIKIHAAPVKQGRKEDIGSHPAIYIVRDGRDALVSHAHYLMDYEGVTGTFHQTLHGLIIGSFSHLRPWGDHTLAWRDREHTTYVRYEDLLVRPVKSYCQCLTELELTQFIPASAEKASELFQSMPSFKDLHEMEPKFFRHGKSRGWLEEMPDELCSLFWEKHGKAMEAYGYGRG